MNENNLIRTNTIDECITLLSFVLKQTEDTFKAEYDETADFDSVESSDHNAYCEGLEDAIKKISELKK